MKRLILSSLIVLALAITFVSAQPILTITDNAQPGETILGQISIENGSFEKKLSQEDLQVYQGDRLINFQSDITFYNNVFYFYILPTYEGNFTLKIPNILYKTDVLKAITLEKQISVKKQEIFDNLTNETQLQILSIKPGFIVSSSKAQITLENLGNVNLSINYDNNNLVIIPGAIKKVYLEPIKQGNFFWISFKTYKTFDIPFIFVSLTEQQIIKFLQPESPTNISINLAEIKINQTCKDLQGQVCLTWQNCTGTPRYTGELCCLGKCYPEELSPEVSYSWLFGLFIIAGLGIIAFIVFYKFKKTTSKTSQQVLKESSLRYEKKQKLR